MIPSFGGGLTNSGSMPISASGGTAGPSSAKGQNDIGGIKNGSINFGSNGPGTWLPWIVVAVGVTWWVMKK
ncbi:hypothetical protein VA7868_02931 [Vibrio aerogenes CECT 7868]|uniref:Uncharacterized protein n=1 Tax=Vibrio aerogenes CECT 7868 TaxID=1216006 RepID=A0A1M5ZMG2_9VIBR|nr:hypothetical protein [Vibrio aerogenes]SHI25328.1 hypothetical protein VA7868_02931 [Vibrio aerogenes CECT 7868]